MKVLIISNGEIKDYGFYKNIVEEVDMVICADGGANHAYKMKIRPFLIIGDFDSVDREVLEFYQKEGVKVEKFPTMKDETDTQLALKKAIELGAKDITFIGVIGDRFDHSYANLSLLLYSLKRGVKSRIINEKNEIHLIDDYIEIEGKKGELLSLLPYSGEVKGIYTKGLFYPLSGQSMSMENPYGISNVFTEEKASIKIEEGFLLVIKPKD
ncbi:thiamine diphosphokinase [Caldanaerobacter subterraneus]|uniref:Thiamine diphosphokinase n=2 Tax=Caldanaerobacter subterraneus TaxID=911092 RepID=Q8R9T9_CALS4|nr:thiamine diphosphokinase [Caldanaerobacter subterraneus]AAM24715.1 Thiamine pyrophosphokinase [Caldanaerobacter subterraneus subsp. tengcongensis MB4]MCS3915721.1 thiamine pyrophosphokinase [Caldanaerobacter subterraneus subsp. tengcongensis MB4]NNG66197.1 thiamine diphosphokinase [Caldanaerobacter subterraneus]TCO67853.1 thiamine pyrophosphokinase [Caldanaerobacter subterraneus]